LAAHLRFSAIHDAVVSQTCTLLRLTHAQSEALALSDRIVVMNQGRVEQISPRHRLYTRPNAPFVAQFIGRNTIFRGTVESSDGDSAVVSTSVGTLSGKANGPVGAGANVNIVTPSEAIEVHACARAKRNHISNEFGCKVVGASVRRFDVVGHWSHLTAALADGHLVLLEAPVDKYARGTFPLRAKILLTWEPGAATVIPAN
jgi:ABC-type Fe3+/spermidine/putrescine transport system ATPase subunit